VEAVPDFKTELPCKPTIFLYSCKPCVTWDDSCPEYVLQNESILKCQTQPMDTDHTYIKIR